MKFIKIALLTAFLAVGWLACSDIGHKEGLKSRLAEHDTAVSVSVSADLAETETVPVEATQEGIKAFFTNKRSHELSSFPCSDCHSGQDMKTGFSEEQKRLAHRKIELVHADSAVMSCTTCHDVKKGDNLLTLNKMPLTFDESFKLCGQCHSSQFKDWELGAHGKRIGGWAPPRTVKTCVSCHNPHQPAFGSRWPARYNTVKAAEPLPDGH